MTRTWQSTVTDHDVTVTPATVTGWAGRLPWRRSYLKIGLLSARPEPDSGGSVTAVVGGRNKERGTSMRAAVPPRLHQREL